MQSFDGGSKQMLNGTMVHDVFQRAATAKDFSSETLSKLAEQALHSPQYLADMYVLISWLLQIYHFCSTVISLAGLCLCL